MRYYACDVTLVDVPGEISLSFAIAGCQLNCKGCFWQQLKAESGELLDLQTYENWLLRYKNYVSCVLFYGGEWHVAELVAYLQLAQQHGLKTCLYTGLKKVVPEIYQQLDYLKTGAYIERLGGLSSPATNQRFRDLKNHVDLTGLFWHKDS